LWASLNQAARDRRYDKGFVSVTNAASPRPGTTEPNRVGQYAGFVSRLLAFVLDIFVSLGLFALAVALISSIIGLLAGHTYNVNRHGVIVEVLFGLWAVVYFAFQWGSNGQTLGMALFGIRVVTKDGNQISRWQALERTAALPLSILFLGLGFLISLVQGERRALHDLIAGTCVVYSWDARAARLRWLARQPTSEPLPSGASNDQ
jgi:uncharacterized RDD family membrane protein YckC